MADEKRTILSGVLRKRLETLGYASLRKFHADREKLGLSYELLRQVVYDGRVPRTESLLAILQAMRFSPAQTLKIMEFYGRGYPRSFGPPAAAARPGPGGAPADPEGANADQESPAAPPAPAAGEAAPSLGLDDPDEIASTLLKLLPKIPLQGNEDFWETLKALARLAERKVQEQALREAGQPLLFEKEPEAIYQFLVRRGKIPAFMSKGEGLTHSFLAGIDYKDRCRGALLGAAVGETLARPAQGLGPRDVQELYGRIEGYDARHAGSGAARRAAAVPASLHLARVLVREGRLDPEKAAAAYAGGPGRNLAASLSEFARNLKERGYPWFEAGVNGPESAPAARVVPLALWRAADFRRMKLEAGIDASVTHPNAAAIAGAVAQAAALVRVLHTAPGTLDVLGFTRGISPAVTGIEPDRAARGRSGRVHATLWRKLGTELTALLLRRAEIEEVRDALGNGPSVIEGLPFGWACFLRHPDDFAAAVLAAVNMGNDAESTAAIAGALCGAYVGASGIPAGLLKDLPFREEIAGAADALLAQARREQ